MALNTSPETALSAVRPTVAPPPSASPATATPAAHPAPTATARSAARPAGLAPSAPAGSIIGIIQAAARRHGVDPAWMVRIASCESGLNPRAYNPAGPYDGLFQFLPSTFYANGGVNIWDPAQQSEVTATMLARGQSREWSCA